VEAVRGSVHDVGNERVQLLGDEVLGHVADVVRVRDCERAESDGGRRSLDPVGGVGVDEGRNEEDGDQKRRHEHGIAPCEQQEPEGESARDAVCV